MIIDTEQIINLLEDRSITGYQIAQATGLNQEAINGYRRGDRKFENFNAKTLITLQKYINQQKDSISRH